MTHNMLTRRVGSLVLLRQNTEEPSDQDWGEFLNLLAAHRKELDSQRLKVLVHTDGGAVSSQQRKRLAETLATIHPKVAVVSNSIKVRFAGAMIALFQRNYRQFAVSEMREAFAHLELTHDQRKIAEQTLYELEAQLYANL